MGSTSVSAFGSSTDKSRFSSRDDVPDVSSDRDGASAEESMVAMVKGWASQGVLLTAGIDKYAIWPGVQENRSGRRRRTRRRRGETTSTRASWAAFTVSTVFFVLPNRKRCRYPPFATKMRRRRRRRSSPQATKEGQTYCDALSNRIVSRSR
jgi:hypothetical protein